MPDPVGGCGKNERQLSADLHEREIKADLQLLSNYEPDGMVCGYNEHHFALEASGGLERFLDSKDVCETLRMQNAANPYEFLAGTSVGIQMTPQDTLVLKEAMLDYIAHLRQQTKGLCTNFQLQSALYLYSELQQAEDNGLYASGYTQSFFPAAVIPEAQAWLRCRGYLGEEEGIENLTSGAIIHFSAPAKDKPMLILYADSGHKYEKIQQGLYDEFLKWHSRGVRHALLECMGYGRIEPAVGVTKEELCNREDLNLYPNVSFYCASDDVLMWGVDDEDTCGICNPCYQGTDLIYLGSVHYRNEFMVDHIEKAAKEYYHEIALMKAGVAHVQHFIDELPLRGIGLMVIEIPQVYEPYKDFVKISKKIKEKCDEIEMLENDR